MIAKRIRERCEQFARDENVYECGHPENGDYVKVDSLVSLCNELLAEKDRQYQQLMAQAVQFAMLVSECWQSDCNMIDAREYEDTQAFLKEHS